jgi:hypothetical protein
VPRLLLAVLLLASGCVIPFAVPGSRFDGGYTLDHRLTGRAGAHLLSLRKERDARLDIGAGVALGAPVSPTMSANGGYLDVAWTQHLDHTTLLSVGPGISLLDVGGALVTASYVRAGVELWTPTEGSGTADDSCGVAVGGATGRTAIGVYVDVARPNTAEGGLMATAGISVRLPGVLGVFVGIPGCK